MNFQILSSIVKNILMTFLVFILMAGCKKAAEVKDEEPNPSPENEEYFQIVVLPDTQYYTALKHNGTMTMFEDQIQWIIDNKEKEKIAYVVHLGDLVDHGNEDNEQEWLRAKDMMYRLGAQQIPFGVAAGNHDQTPLGKPGAHNTTTGFGNYFGKAYFADKTWFGGVYNNDANASNHFDLFSANGQDFIVIYLEYNEPTTDYYNDELSNSVLNWLDNTLTTHHNRKAIIVSHYILKAPAGSDSDIKAGVGNNSVASEFGTQGAIIYNTVKKHKNVFMMLGGHRSGEGYRQDAYNGNIIQSFLADYQSRENYPYDGSNRNGGNGLMRLMKFSKTKKTISVKTFAPRKIGADINETDGDSNFTKTYY